MFNQAKWNKSHRASHVKSDTLHRGTIYLVKFLLVLEGAGCTVASDGDIIANYLALLPLVVIGKYF